MANQLKPPSRSATSLSTEPPAAKSTSTAWQANVSALSGDDALNAAFEENSRDVARIGGS